MRGKKRTSVLIDQQLLRRARRILNASTNTEAISRALEATLINKEIEVSLRALIRKGRGRVVDVYQ